MSNYINNKNGTRLKQEEYDMKERQRITEEMHLEKEWFEQTSKIKTIDQLTDFINHVINDYDHDYGTACHAIGAATAAAAWYGANVEGITGFQASFAMWDFIKNWIKNNNECGLKLIDYDDFLYPQYQYKFEKTISQDVWLRIREQAKKNLESNESACLEVQNHWKNIACGIVPFGYTVKE